MAPTRRLTVQYRSTLSAVTSTFLVATLMEPSQTFREEAILYRLDEMHLEDFNVSHYTRAIEEVSV